MINVNPQTNNYRMHIFSIEIKMNEMKNYEKNENNKKTAMQTNLGRNCKTPESMQLSNGTLIGLARSVFAVF